MGCTRNHLGPQYHVNIITIYDPSHPFPQPGQTIEGLNDTEKAAWDYVLNLPATTFHADIPKYIIELVYGKMILI